MNLPMPPGLSAAAPEPQVSELPPGINRRAAIKQLALMCGLALSATSLGALAASFSNPRDMSRASKSLLSPAQLALLKQLGELIIPTTDTPGAIAAGVHDFINHQLVYCFSPQDQKMHLDGLDRLAGLSQQLLGKDFLSATQAQQVALLTQMEAAQKPFTQNDRNYFKQLKSLVVFGYYTSEIGATKELAFLPVPGGYKGHFKFSQIGRAWSLL